MHCVLVTGEIASGKTAAAQALTDALTAQLVKVRFALASILDIDPLNRLDLQRKGAALDRRTNGRWLLEYLLEHGEGQPGLVVDSVRTRLQALPVLEHVTDSYLVYLNAHDETRKARYERAAATDPVKASVPYEVAMRHPTEAEVLHLRAMAHLVIETDDLSPDEVAREIQELLTNSQ